MNTRYANIANVIVAMMVLAAVHFSPDPQAIGFAFVVYYLLRIEDRLRK